MAHRRDDALPWWQRQKPSVLVLAVVLTVLGVATVAVASRVVRVLPEVGKDQLGQDRWTDPLGLELGGGLLIAHVPDCAAGSITRIALWDADSRPYWEVAGPATPMKAFVVGARPSGFTEVVRYREPPPGTVLRLVAFRKVGGVVGIRYQTTSLRQKRVVSGTSLTSYTIDGFQSAAVCGKTSAKGAGGVPSTVPDGTTTIPG